MIPKIIHYCWFGRNPKPKDVLECIASWTTFLPDYEIKEWNEDNYDVNKCQFMREAYKEKKWAFVSDYCRIDVVNQYGGIYLDTDVEVLKSFDSLLGEKFFCGFEGVEPEVKYKKVAFGLGFGSEAHHPILEEILDFYERSSFDENKQDLSQITCPVIQTNALHKFGLVPNGETQRNNLWVAFSEEYFCPMNYCTHQTKITSNTYSIHHYSATWVNPFRRKFSDFLMSKLHISHRWAVSIIRLLTGETFKQRFKR